MLTTKPVPNKFPTTTANGLAIIGEAPGAEEFYQGEPFVGASGRFLKAVLRKCDIDPNATFYGNICQHQPPQNDITKFDELGDEFLYGLTALREDLDKYRPSMLLLLGNTALRQFALNPPSVSVYRGSLFLSRSDSPSPSTKSLATYHPAGVLRQYSWAPLFHFDVLRVKEEHRSPILTLPERRILTGTEPSLFGHLINELQRCLIEKVQLSVDIEGGVNGVTCIGFARSPLDAFVVPLLNRDLSNIWPPEQEFELWRLISRVLEDPMIPKTLQNSLYDAFVLAWRHKVLIRGIKDDTMLKHWELYSEMEKGLGVQASIYTREPYYKQERGDSDYLTYLRYCGKDCCVTAEANNTQDQYLVGPPRDHYRFNMQLLPLFLYMELQGIKYNYQEALARRQQVLEKQYTAQHEIDKLAGRAVSSDTTALSLIVEDSKRICTSRAQKRGIYDVATLCDNLLAPYKPYAGRLAALLAKEPATWSAAENAEYCEITDRGMNIRGDGYLQFFYKTICQPVVRKRDTGQPTCDYETVLRLFKKTKHKLCEYHLIVADCRTHQQMLTISPDADGRVRCSYNVVGTDTGRVTCYTSPTGSGYNLQTIPEDDRDLFLGDDGYDVFQCDLRGADAWTVACWCAKMGDRTMLDDLLYGLAPAKILACMFIHGPEVSTQSREQLAIITKSVSKQDPIYFGSKCCQHGSNYDMGDVTMSSTIFKQSLGKVDLPSATCGVLRQMYLKRYWGVPLWHRYVANICKTTQRLSSASGHVRVIMGRPDDHETIKAALADEPQQNTTYATNLAAHRLYYDPENRDSQSRLIIRPLHQVHDALVGQWPIERREWAIQKVRQWFNNPITIAGQTVVIPFEGSYGPAWGGRRTGTIPSL